MKKIVATHILFESNIAKRIIVLWDDNGDFRATAIDCNKNERTQVVNDITPKVLQYVSDYGDYINSQEKEEYFPMVKSWSR